jgi:hypothetical protein
MDEREAADRRPETPTHELFLVLRNEVKHEDDLIGQRLNWFTASQAFLLVSLAIAHRGETDMPTPLNNTLFPLVPIVALSSSILIFLGVIAGIAALAQWRARLRRLAYRHPELPYVAYEKFIVPAAWSAPLALPLVFIGAWLFLLAHGYGVIR